MYSVYAGIHDDVVGNFQETAQAACSKHPLHFGHPATETAAYTVRAGAMNASPQRPLTLEAAFTLSSLTSEVDAIAASS